VVRVRGGASASAGDDSVTDVFDTNRPPFADVSESADPSGASSCELDVDREVTLSYSQLRDSAMLSPSCEFCWLLAFAIATLMSATICRSLSTASTDLWKNNHYKTLSASR